MYITSHVYYDETNEEHQEYKAIFDEQVEKPVDYFCDHQVYNVKHYINFHGDYEGCEISLFQVCINKDKSNTRLTWLRLNTCDAMLKIGDVAEFPFSIEKSDKISHYWETMYDSEKFQ